MKKIFVLLLVIGLSLKVYSQNHIKQDTLLRKSFQELSDLFYNSKPDSLKATIYAKKYFSKALKEKDTTRMMIGKYLLADILNNKEIYLNFCDSLINITKKKPNKNFPASIYMRKGKYFFQRGINDESLNNYFKAIDYIKVKKNDSLLYISKYYLGLLKSKINRPNESIKLYKEVYNYSLRKGYLNHKSDFYTILLNIPIAYKKNNQIDSAYYYCKFADSIYTKNKDSLYLGSLYYVYGKVVEKKKQFLKAITLLKKSEPYQVDDENNLMLVYTYSTIAKCYDSLKNTTKALEFYLKVDSLHNKYNIESQVLENTFKYLKNHYDKTGNLNKQLYFLDKLIEVSSKNKNKTIKLNKHFTEKYDIPNLISEKKQVIERLEKELKESRRNRMFYISLLVLSLALIGYQIKRKRSLKKRFIVLVNQKEVADKEKIKPVTKTTNKYELSDETINTIMKGLEVFEKNTDFLNSKINLQLLADRLDTNTSYLSKVINQYKKNSFSNYINQLRVKYTIEKLKKDSLWRKYTIKAIAQEVGFKNAESFSKAFFKHTGLKPSYFIKELVKVKDHKSS